MFCRVGINIVRIVPNWLDRELKLVARGAFLVAIVVVSNDFDVDEENGVPDRYELLNVYTISIPSLEEL